MGSLPGSAKGKNEGTSEFRVNRPCCLGSKEEVGVVK